MRAMQFVFPVQSGEIRRRGFGNIVYLQVRVDVCQRAPNDLLDLACVEVNAWAEPRHGEVSWLVSVGWMEPGGEIWALWGRNIKTQRDKRGARAACCAQSGGGALARTVGLAFSFVRCLGPAVRNGGWASESLLRENGTGPVCRCWMLSRFSPRFALLVLRAEYSVLCFVLRAIMSAGKIRNCTQPLVVGCRDAHCTGYVG